MTELEEELAALESRLASLRTAHAALGARVEAARDFARTGVPIRVFLLPLAAVATAGASLGLLAVELGKVIP